MDIDQETSSGYLAYLPAIFSEDKWLGQFLLAFEHALTGLGDVNTPGLEEILEGIVDQDGNRQLAGLERYFHPGPDNVNSVVPEDVNNMRAPRGFLDWLAGWVALSIRADWDEEKQREYLANIVSFYRRRGTKENLKEFLKIYTRLDPTITETQAEPLRIGDTRIGETTQIGGGIPHHFRVDVVMDGPKPLDIIRQRKILHALINLQKPAHTTYELRIRHLTMKIGERATIGEDTLISSRAE